MNLLTNVGTAMTRTASKMLFKARKFAPELLIGAGAAAIITGTVMACKATKRAEEYINNAKDELDILKDNHEDHIISDNQYNREVRLLKAKTLGHLVGTYAISGAVITTGLAMIFTSHGIMKKRNGAMLAAYNALEAAFQKYRERVKADEDGLARDRKYMFGDDEYPRENDELAVNDIYEINKKGLSQAQASGLGPYTFEFSKFSSTHWSPHDLSNLNTIRSAEDWANRQLRLYGHLFLNDVLKYLGIDEVPWGQLVGWLRGNQDGDNYVQLLATEQQRNLEMDYDGWKKPIWLEMNCDGPIWDRI